MYTSYSRRSIGQLNRNRVFPIGQSSEINAQMIFDAEITAQVKRCIAEAVIVKGDLVIEPGETFYLVQSSNQYFQHYFYLVVERDGDWYTSIPVADTRRDVQRGRLIAQAQAHKAHLGKRTVTVEILTAPLETPAKVISAGTTVYHICGQTVVYEWIWDAWECTCCEDGHGASYRNCEHVQAVLAHLN